MIRVLFLLCSSYTNDIICIKYFNKLNFVGYNEHNKSNTYKSELFKFVLN